MAIKNDADNRMDDDDINSLIGSLDNGFDDEDEAEAFDRGDDIDGEVDDEEEPEAEAEEEPEAEAEEEPEAEAEEEPEAEAEEEPEAEAEEEPEAEGEEEPKKGSDDNGFIPRSRLNKEIRKRRELEDRIRELEVRQSSQREEPAAVAKAVEKAAIDREQLNKVVNAILDGEPDSATDALVQVLEAISTQSSVPQASPDEISRLVEEKFEADALKRHVSEVITANPFLDDSNDDTFDADAAQDVVDLKTMYEQRGMRPVEALNQAVAKVSAQYGYNRTETKQEPVKTAPKKLKPANVEAKTKLAQKMPNRVPTPTSSQTRDKVSLANLSEDEFEGLSREALRRARGDFV